MIGADFEKIQFVLFGLNLVEPMAFITDIIMGSISMYLGVRIHKIKSNLAFYTYWKWFFWLFGFGALAGAFGHTFYNYFGTVGKIPSWISGPTSVYCIEQAMISVYPSEKGLKNLKLISTLKLVAVLTIFFFILGMGPVGVKPNLPFLPIAINTIVGVMLSAGILGMIYAKKFTRIYKYFYFGVLIMVPSAFIFLMKVNLHQWFDKNDLSHVLLTAGIIYFYIGIKKISKGNIEPVSGS